MQWEPGMFGGYFVLLRGQKNGVVYQHRPALSLTGYEYNCRSLSRFYVY